MHVIRCMLNFDKGHEMSANSKCKPPSCNLGLAFVFGLSFGLGLGLLFMSPWGEELRGHFMTFIYRMHKWWATKYSFVFVLIRLTSLVSTDKIQTKCSFRTRLVGLISTKTKEYFVGSHLCIRSIVRTSCQKWWWSLRERQGDTRCDANWKWQASNWVDFWT